LIKNSFHFLFSFVAQNRFDKLLFEMICIIFPSDFGQVSFLIFIENKMLANEFFLFSIFKPTA